MPTPKKTKRQPVGSKQLTTRVVSAPAGSNTLDRVIFCIDPYTNISPILPTYKVGALCPDLDFLGADLNIEFRLRRRQQYWQGEIEKTWTVRYLADYTDLKRAVIP